MPVILSFILMMFTGTFVGAESTLQLTSGSQPIQLAKGEASSRKPAGVPDPRANEGVGAQERTGPGPKHQTLRPMWNENDPSCHVYLGDYKCHRACKKGELGPSRAECITYSVGSGRGDIWCDCGTAKSGPSPQ